MSLEQSGFSLGKRPPSVLGQRLQVGQLCLRKARTGSAGRRFPTPGVQARNGPHAHSPSAVRVGGGAMLTSGHVSVCVFDWV